MSFFSEEEVSCQSKYFAPTLYFSFWKILHGLVVLLDWVFDSSFVFGVAFCDFLTSFVVFRNFSPVTLCVVKGTAELSIFRTSL